MEPTPAPVAAPAKKSNAPMIIAIIGVAILSLCCCLPGIINIVSPLPYTTTTSGLFGESTDTGTLPGWYGVFCICAAVIPWLVLGIVALVRRSKK
jgi:hypothetical protein